MSHAECSDFWPHYIGEMFVHQRLDSERRLVLALTLKPSMLLYLKQLVFSGQCIWQVLLQPSRAELLKRLQERAKIGRHFMPASLLESQLATLEPEGKNIIAIQGTAIGSACTPDWPAFDRLLLSCAPSKPAQARFLHCPAS